ncbi:MAG TPA: hypothetical protein VFU95_09290, partial [Telluria sp.]|nr:hypothetical protein [Telluria sp.]
MRTLPSLGAASLLLTLVASSAFADAPVCVPQPAGTPTLYMLGGMNGWSAREEYAFTYSCDAYYLNVELTGRAEFKVSDNKWSNSSTYGSPATAETNLLKPGQPYAAVDGTAPGGANNLGFAFSGAHTVKLIPGPSGQIAQVAIGPLTFPAKPGAVVTEPVALSLAYDSRKLADKAPFGAVAAGTPVSFALAALPGVTSATLVVERRKLEGNEEVLEYSEVARVALTKSGSGARERWSATYRFADASVYGYYFLVEAGGRQYVYQNNNDYVYWTRERGSDGRGLVAPMPASASAIRRYRQTVYAPGYKVPSWARDAVYYYIFPERFRNGDRANDPKPGRDKYQDK